MSLDYPFYQELKKRRHPGARWWLAGDVIYYFGLLLGLFGIPSVLVYSLIYRLEESRWPIFGSGWKTLLWLSIGLACSVAVFVGGALLKRKSYIMAHKDGINVNDY